MVLSIAVVRALLAIFNQPRDEAPCLDHRRPVPRIPRSALTMHVLQPGLERLPGNDPAGFSANAGGLGGFARPGDRVPPLRPEPEQPSRRKLDGSHADRRVARQREQVGQAVGEHGRTVIDRKPVRDFLDLHRARGDPCFPDIGRPAQGEALRARMIQQRRGDSLENTSEIAIPGTIAQDGLFQCPYRF